MNLNKCGILFSGLILLGSLWGGAAPAKEKSMRQRSTAPVPAAGTSESAESVKKYSPRVDAWLKRMRRHLTHTQTRQNKLISVAAVRGNQVSDAPPLYWKGKEMDKTVGSLELEAFEQALGLAEAGKIEQVQNSLKQFIAAHPNSPLKSEAEEMSALLALE